MHNAFAAVDVSQEGFLNYRNIQAFLRMHGQFASDEQVIAMVRRLDADADQMVQFPEFCELLNPVNVGPAYDSNPYSLKTAIRRNKDKKNLSESTAGRRVAKSANRSASVRKSARAKSAKKRYPNGDSPLRTKSASNRMNMPRYRENSNRRTVSFAAQEVNNKTMPARNGAYQRSGSPLRHQGSRGDLLTGSPRGRGGSPLRAGGSPGRDSPLKDLMTPSRFLGYDAKNAADLSYKYK